MTDIRPVVIRQELMASYHDIETLIEEVKKRARTLGIPAQEMRDSDGNWVMIPLIVARIQILHALTLLNKGD